MKQKTHFCYENWHCARILGRGFKFKFSIIHNPALYMVKLVILLVRYESRPLLHPTIHIQLFGKVGPLQEVDALDKIS